jgi:hypothetical protein
LDTAFNQNFLVATGGASLEAIAIQPNGKIIVGDNFTVQTPFT